MSMHFTVRLESAERKPDGTFVAKFKLKDSAMVPELTQIARARGRAMVEAGVVDVSSKLARDIADAVTQLKFSEIDRRTEVINRTEDTVTVRVE